MIAISNIKLKSAFVALVSCLLLAGCQTAGEGGGDVDPRLTETDSAKFFTKAAAQGCAAGALTGVLACALTNSSNKAACMAIAAAAGCGAGATAAYVIDSRRAKYSNKEIRMDALIADVQDDNKKLEARLKDVQVVMRDNQQTLKTLQTQLANKQIDKKNAQAQLNRLTANKARLESELVDANARIQQFEDAIQMKRAQGENIQAMQAEVAKLKRTRDLLSGDINVTYSLLPPVKAVADSV